MTNLSRDELRVVICFAGILGLFFQLVGQTVFGAEIGQGLTGAFVTLATLPVVDSAWEKFKSRRGPNDDPPDPPEESRSSQIQRRSDQQQTERDHMDLVVAV